MQRLFAFTVALSLCGCPAAGPSEPVPTFDAPEADAAAATDLDSPSDAARTVDVGPAADPGLPLDVGPPGPRTLASTAFGAFEPWATPIEDRDGPRSGLARSAGALIGPLAVG